MRCENIQEIISSFIDGELVENIDEAFSHVFSCVDCQEFLTISLKFKVEASKDQIKFPEGRKLEIPARRSLKERLRGAFKIEIPVPAPLLSAVVVMLFVLSFLLAVFVYDKATTIEVSKNQAPIYKERTRTVIVYGIPQVTIYPDTKEKK